MTKRALIACEGSQAVTIEMRKLGVEAYSCDILPCSGGHPEWHIQGDVVVPLISERWDMVIAFPPCTHLCVSGAKWFKQKREDGRQQSAIDFFMLFTHLDGMWAIENPVGIMSTVYRKPDQIIQPWQFGHGEVKKHVYGWMDYRHLSRQMLSMEERRGFSEWRHLRKDQHSEAKLIQELRAQWQSNGEHYCEKGGNKT